MTVKFSPETQKIRGYSRMHPEAYKFLREPMDYLSDFLRIGFLEKNTGLDLVYGNLLIERFKQKQEKLIANSINNCSRTAWVMPNYFAQIFFRSLRKAGNHSDVSIAAYTKPVLVFYFEALYLPSSLIQRFSMIQNTGLLEWWPKVINRSDLVINNENKPPTKPNMSGNIRVIFDFLGSGIAIGVSCMILEVSSIF